MEGIIGESDQDASLPSRGVWLWLTVTGGVLILLYSGYETGVGIYYLARTTPLSFPTVAPLTPAFLATTFSSSSAEI